MRAQRCYRPMDQGPVSADFPWQQSRILVLRLHDDAVAFETPEVSGERERYSWATPGERGIRDGVLLQLRYVSDTRILDTPALFAILSGFCGERRRRVDAPSIDSVRGPSHSQMRQPAPVFYAAQKQSIAVGQPHRARIENAVDRIGPVIPAQNWISGAR